EEMLSRFSSTPGVNRNEQIVFHPHRERWLTMQQEGILFQPYDLMDISRVATDGKFFRFVPFKGEDLAVRLTYPPNFVKTLDELEGMPLVVGDKLIPMKAVVDMTFVREEPPLYKENGT